MEEVIDTVATILSDGGTTIASCVRFTTIMILLSGHRWGIGQCRYLHHLAKVAEKCSWFTELDGFVERLASGAHEPLRVFVHSADGVRLVQVSVEACSVSQKMSSERPTMVESREASPSLYTLTSDAAV